jgi:hypothetical protein
MDRVDARDYAYFKVGVLYRVRVRTYGDSGRRTEDSVREMRYMGRDYADRLLFDARPEGGTQTIDPGDLVDAAEVTAI